MLRKRSAVGDGGAPLEGGERFRAAAQSAVEAFVSIDSEGSIVFWNPAAERIFGYSSGEILGKPIELIMPSSLREMHRNGLGKFFSEGRQVTLGITMECTGLRKGGKEFPIEFSTSAWKADGKQFFTGIVRDITERKQAEEKLKKYSEELEEKLSLLEGKGVRRSEFLLRDGNSYLVKEKNYEKSMALFYNLAPSGAHALCVTAVHPNTVKSIYPSKGFDCRYIWLTTSANYEGAVSPANLTALNVRIAEFLKQDKGAVVHFMGLENLITVNGFEAAFNFVKSVVDNVALSSAKLLFSVNPEAMDPRELSLVEKSLVEITDEDLERLGIKPEGGKKPAKKVSEQ